MRGAGQAEVGGLQVRSKLVEKTLEAEVSKSHRLWALQGGWLDKTDIKGSLALSWGKNQLS